LPKAAGFVAFVTPIFNLLSVIALTLPHYNKLKWNEFKKSCVSIGTNPLILSTVAGFMFSIFKIPLPDLAVKTLDPIGKTALPLALISVGCSFDFDSVKKGIKRSLGIVGAKLIFMPLFALILLKAFKFPSIDIGITVIMLATPTAIVSYIMAKEMKGDSDLAANAVMTTTLFSVVTLSAWLFLVT
jgi:hypothetical protein